MMMTRIRILDDRWCTRSLNHETSLDADLGIHPCSSNLFNLLNFIGILSFKIFKIGTRSSLCSL